MPGQLFETAGQPFWNEAEIEHREYCIRTLRETVSRSLQAINRGWTLHRCEGPILTACSRLNHEYDGGDVWLLQRGIAGETACLRPETTPSSYAYARSLIGTKSTYTPPICVWQVGKSFRVEANDGASASKLRFNEFYQQEFQCIYPLNTKADYRAAIMPDVEGAISWLTGRNTRVVDSDRLPSYSLSTLDVEVERANGRWTEAASISIRTDFDDRHRVLEIAIGIDRLVCAKSEGTD